MTWLDDGDVRLYHGDALEQLAAMPAESVQCIVTSPPFWALRDYGVDGQIGLEATPDEWCQRLVAVFRECRRVLRDDGVMWLECGDTYNANQGSGFESNKATGTATRRIAADLATKKNVVEGIKPKDLVGAPWMLAFALRADGWYLRSDTIWARPNPMPESVTDRPTKAHSYVFLLTKSARYFYDADAIREASTGDQNPRNTNGQRERDDKIRGFENRVTSTSKNVRSVWSIATEPTPFAHFATFPQALVERCIKAGTSERGGCAACGAPWTRVTERVSVREQIGDGLKGGKADELQKTGQRRDGLSHSNSHNGSQSPKITTTGWVPTCSGVRCGGEGTAVVPCVVLDPFMGSGTTALVARRLGRHAVGIELNADYLKIAATRLQQLSLLGDAS